MSPTLLAVLCSKVAEESSVDAEAREKARTLQAEWARLQTSPLNFQEKKAQDVKKDENRRKMAEFLSDLINRL